MGQRLVLIAALLAAPAAAEQTPSLGAGSSFTAGSAGYHKFALYGDGEWRLPPWTPYAWTEFGVDNFLNEFTLGGGTWKDLNPALRVKGGLAFTFGRINGAPRESSSYTLETGVEKDLAWPTLGAEYRFTSGTIGGTSNVPNQDQLIRDRGRGRQAVVAPQPYSYNEFSGYARLPAGKTSVKLRLTLDLPSYSRGILSETLGWKVPFKERWSVTPAVSFEQSPTNGVYFSLALYYLFG